MTTSNLKEMVKNEWFQFVTPILLTGVMGLTVYMANGMFNRLDRIETFMTTLQTNDALKELRLKQVEAVTTVNSAAIQRLSDKVLVQEFRLQDVRQGEHK